MQPDKSGWLCTEGCGRCDIRGGIDFPADYRCLNCNATAFQFVAVDALLSDEAVEAALQARWAIDDEDAMRDCLRAAVNAVTGEQR